SALAVPKKEGYPPRLKEPRRLERVNNHRLKEPDQRALLRVRPPSSRDLDLDGHFSAYGAWPSKSKSLAANPARVQPNTGEAPEPHSRDGGFRPGRAGAGSWVGAAVGPPPGPLLASLRCAKRGSLLRDVDLKSVASSPFRRSVAEAGGGRGEVPRGG